MSESMFPTFSIAAKGSEQFPRFVLYKGNGFQNPVYWNEDDQDWHLDEEKATKFADVNEAMWAHHLAILEGVKDLPKHDFVFPMYVTLRGNKKPSLEKVRKWLLDVIRIVIKDSVYGEKPDETCVGFVVAGINQIKESKL